jgi:hypothetical protein
MSIACPITAQQDSPAQRGALLVGTSSLEMNMSKRSATRGTQRGESGTSFIGRAKARAKAGTKKTSAKRGTIVKAAPVSAPNLTAAEAKRAPALVGAIIDTAKDGAGNERPRLIVAQWLDTLGKYDEPAESSYGASIMFSGREPWHPAVLVSAKARALAHKHPEADTLGALLDALAGEGCSAPEATLALRSRFDEKTRATVRAKRQAEAAAEAEAEAE